MILIGFNVCIILNKANERQQYNKQKFEIIAVKSIANAHIAFQLARQTCCQILKALVAALRALVPASLFRG